MTILIINNYYEVANLGKVGQITHALRNLGKNKQEIWSFWEVNEKKVSDDVEAIVLSGSTAHLHNQDHLSMYSAEVELIKQTEVPVLGICFGHQLIGKAFGSKIDALPRFIGQFANVKIREPNEIFHSWKKGKEITVCQSHRDYLTSRPDEFVWLAESESCRIEAMKHKGKPIYGVQAHIERATDENPDGWQVLKNFISNVAEKC